MPQYAFVCEKCGHSYSEFRPMKDCHPLACSQCGEVWGDLFRQDFSKSKVTGIVYDQPKTFGQQAELNAKRLGKEQLQLLADDEKNQRRHSEYTGPLPQGARIDTTGTDAIPPWRDGSMGSGKLDKPLKITAVKDLNRYVVTGETK